VNQRISDELFRARSAAPPAAAESEQRDPVHTVSEALGELRHLIATYPGASLAVAASIGLLIGWWAKRK
jgi:hypothetical protein